MFLGNLVAGISLSFKALHIFKVLIMGLIGLLMSRRSIELGPEDPAEIVDEMYAIINDSKWKLDIALGVTAAASGIIVLFLLLVFLWRRALVNRVSLRLIFAISLLDFVGCIVQIAPQPGRTLLQCRIYGFLMEFFIFASIYMSASIAFNLQMTFLRSSRAPLPAYVEYLYYIVPISVVLLQFVPQYIWASKHGYCRAFDPVMPATNHYIVYIIFVQMGIPTIFIFYNVITCVWVILSLNSKQRKVSKALDEATARTKLLLDDSPNTSSLGSDSTVPKSRPVPTREQQQLMAVRRVYRACIRIALYPLAPLIWWICIGAFYIGQYFFSFTWKRDAYMMARFMELNWYTSFVTVLANFIVFLSDAAVLHVVSEVYKLVMRKLGIQSKHAEHGSSAVDKTKKRLPKKPSVAITESDKCATATVDDISLASADFNYYPASTPGAMEENRPYTSSIAGLQDDVVTRRVRGNADVKNFLDEM